MQGLFENPQVERVVTAAVQVNLLSSDSQKFEVTEEVAFMSETIKNTLEGACCGFGMGTSCCLLHYGASAFIFQIFNSCHITEHVDGLHGSNSRCWLFKREAELVHCDGDHKVCVFA